MWSDPSEEFIRERILAGSERGKLDFKTFVDTTSKRDRAELAKLISAMANVDSAMYDNHGYIILGAERRNLVGGMDVLQDDAFSSNLQQQVNAYLNPPVPFELKAFHDTDKGWFGVLIIPPPSSTYQRPHFIHRAYSDKGLTLLPGQCFVRIGDRIEIAQQSDYERMYHARYSTELAEARREIALLREKTPILDINVKHRVAMGMFGPTKHISTDISIYTEPDIESSIMFEQERLMRELESISGKRYLSLEQRQQYLSDLRMYIQEYRIYYQRITEHNEHMRYSAYVRPFLTNESHALAENVIIHFHIPPELSAFDERSMMRPAAPKPPQISSSQVSTATISADSSLAATPNYRSMPHIEGPIIEMPYFYVVIYKVDRVQKPDEQELPPFFIKLPSEEEPKSIHYDLPYTIFARDMKATEGKLELWVEYTRS